MKRYFITHVCPQLLCGKYNISYAASNFSWALINSEVFDECYSILPTNVRGNVDDIRMKELIYSDLRKKNGLLQKIAVFVENWTIFKKIESNSSVWLYNLSILNILLFLLLKVFKPSVKVNIIILDIYIPAKRFSFENLLIWGQNHCDGTIRLSNSKFLTCRNSVCLPGVIAQNTPDFPKINVVTKDFLLSGLLREDISQISLVIKTFAALPDFTLHITGFSDSDDLLREKCSKFANIHYYGQIDFEKYIELLHNTPFLLSMRDPFCLGNHANFPSKVIEAILHNRIIISTIHYEQLNGLKYFEVTSEKETLINELKRIVSMPTEELMCYANQSSFVINNFSPKQWGVIMSKIENN